MHPGNLVDDPAIGAGIEEVRRLGDGLGKALAGQVGDQALVRDAGQAALGAGGEADALAGLGAAHGGFEHLLAGEDDHDRPAELARRERRGDGLVRDAELGPEATADEGREQADCFGLMPRASASSLRLYLSIW